MCSNPCESELTCFRPESNRGPYGLLNFSSAALSTTELWWRMNHRKFFRTLHPLSKALLPFAPFEEIQSAICLKPVSVPHGCSGFVHWCGCVCTRQRKRQQERATHTLQVTALEFSSQRKRQQESTYHPNNRTRVQTQGLSRSSSALLPPCVLNQIGWTQLRTLVFQQLKIFGREFQILDQKSIFSALRVMKGGGGWLIGWLMVYFPACMSR